MSANILFSKAVSKMYPSRWSVVICTCLNSSSLLCSDRKCKLVKHRKEFEDKARLERVQQTINEYKLSLGLRIDQSFLDLNKKNSEISDSGKIDAERTCLIMSIY